MKQWPVLAGIAAILVTPVAVAQSDNAEIAELRKMLENAVQRIDELEAQQAAETAAQAEYDAADTAVDTNTAEQVAENTERLNNMDWAERFRIKGDFRYRYQNDDVSGIVAPGLDDENDSRNRNRIRARIGIYAELPNDFEVGFGLASGSNDPVSANTTLGGGTDSKDVFLDLAYFDWTGLENTSVRGGKVKNTFVTVGKSGLQWDGDWRPEGGGIAWDNETFFAQGFGTYLESDSDKGNNEFAYLLQVGARAELGPVKLTGGVGYTDIDAEGSACFFEGDDLADEALCLGNQSALNGDGELSYINDFQVYNVFGEAGFEVFNLPVSVFGDYIKNADADDYDTGYLVGFQVGKLKNAGSWKFKYYYEDIEANSTLALLANSDFGGGGTNGKGSVFTAGYGLTDEVNLKATYYLVERNSDNINTINLGEDFDFDTLQLDINFKY